MFLVAQRNRPSPKSMTKRAQAWAQLKKVSKNLLLACPESDGVLEGLLLRGLLLDVSGELGQHLLEVGHHLRVGVELEGIPHRFQSLKSKYHELPIFCDPVMKVVKIYFFTPIPRSHTSFAARWRG